MGGCTLFGKGFGNYDQDIKNQNVLQLNVLGITGTLSHHF